VAGLTGQEGLALGFAVLGAVILAALVVAGRWLFVAGFTPFWGAMTFPLAAYATAVLAVAEVPGLVVLALAVGVVPAIVWKVLALWPGNRLAGKTNAAEA
jgi:tellurite resistance protein